MLQIFTFVIMCVELYLTPRTLTECVDGTFGFNCVNNCSGYCSNDSLCNKQTGHCDRGCKPGYSNSDCGKSKFFTYFFISRCFCEKRIRSMIIADKKSMHFRFI